MDRSSKRAEQTNESYQLIGEYIVYFQRTISQLQDMTRWVFRGNGLHDMHMVDVFLAKRTAMDILEVSRGVFNYEYSPEQEEYTLIDSLFKDIKREVEWRNKLIHADLYVGYSDSEQTEFDEFPGVYIGRNKSGPVFDVQQYSNSFLKEHVLMIKGLAGRVFSLNNFYKIKAFDKSAPIVLSEYLERKVNI